MYAGDNDLNGHGDEEFEDLDGSDDDNLYVHGEDDL